jgi:RNA polymerase sigma-70 factor, ECF subfamily
MVCPDSPPPLQVVPSRPPASAITDPALVQGLIDKEEWAAATLWSRYGALVYRIADRGLGSPQEAEDLTQDVFLCLFHKIASLRDQTALRSFVVSITVRTLKWKLRRRQVRRWIHLTETGELPDRPIRGIDVDEALRRFYRLLDKLSPEERLIFILRHVDELRLQDVAHAMGLSLATVKRRLRRADAQLSRLMESEPLLVTYLRGEGNHP